MLTYIPSIEALERFKAECKHEEANLLTGKCQLCIDALLFMTPIPVPTDSLTSSMRVVDEISANIKTSLALSGDEYLLDLIGRCPSVKIIHPSSIPFNGYVDLSLLESCIALELVRIPFSRLTGIDGLRNRLRSLVWIRGYNDEDANDESESASIFTTFHPYDTRNMLKSNLNVDEIFWDRFGTWPLLNYLCISQSNISNINTSTMPPSIKTLDLRMNRIYHFSNQANNMLNTLTKLCLDYNSLKELPKLSDNTYATLVHLSLRGNLIDSVVGLRNFASLDYLDLSENSIYDVRQLLNEFMHLSKTLKTVYIEKNPVTFAKSFASKCQSVLYQMVKFNGNPVKSNLHRARRNDLESVPIPINAEGSMLQASTSNRYGTFLATDIEESTRTEGLDDSFDRQRKAKALKERFVVINEQGDEEGDHLLLVVPPQPNVSANTHQVAVEINANISNDNLSKKNYLFGGVSGSYSSFKQLAPIEAHAEIASSSVKSQHLTEELLEAEKNKLLQKRMELGEDWLRGGKEDTQTNNIILANKNAEPNNEDKVQLPEQAADNEQVPKKIDIELNETGEWEDEDTENENIFLVEIYSNEAEFLQSLNDEPSGDYFFIRVRPRDGLLFEKDCTSGKVLTTLDLKILEHYQCLPRDMPESESTALRLLFDTTIASKRERIYQFVEENQCALFSKLYLSNYGQYKNNFEADLAANANAAPKALLSSTPLSRSGNYSWFYMCLRCGYRTHRIITDCSKCHSDLIIKDEGTSATAGDLQKPSTPLQPSTPVNGSNGGHLEHNSNEHQQQQQVHHEESSTVKDDTSILSEENIDNEPSLIDENYFKTNIDHHLKLNIEIFIYEQIDEIKQSESIESLCHCMAFDFASRSFTPVLVVFTQNYIFVFDHQVGAAATTTSTGKPQEQNEVRLRFFRPLAGPRASPFIISHLPEQLKNQGYWIECGPSSEVNSKKRADKKKKRKKSKTKQPDHVLELLLFDDKCIGKAFLQLFLHEHRACVRANHLAEQSSETSLVVIKADITELTHMDEDRFVANEKTAALGKRKVALNFDESCQSVLSDLEDPSPYSSSPSSSSCESVSFFLVRSFNLIPNINKHSVAGSSSGGGKFTKTVKDNLFKVENNLLFMVTKVSLALCQLSGHFAAIAPTIASLRRDESIARALQSCAKFEDRIDFRLLIKDLIVNLLPNIYIDKGQLLLVLRFRDEDYDPNSGQRSPVVAGPADHPKSPRSGLIVYDFQIQFFNLNTLKRASKLIQTLWEENFGVSLTLSKHVPLST